jgi:hypothetical protein
MGSSTAPKLFQDPGNFGASESSVVTTPTQQQGVAANPFSLPPPPPPAPAPPALPAPQGPTNQLSYQTGLSGPTDSPYFSPNSGQKTPFNMGKFFGNPY